MHTNPQKKIAYSPKKNILGFVLFFLSFISWSPTSFAVTLDIRVSAVLDDAEPGNSGSSDLDLGQNYSGVRFQAVTIPAGATITNAYIIFDSRSNNSGATSTTIYGENNVNPNNFTTADPQNRPHTTASVAWNIPAWSPNEVGADTTSPDLSVIIQEIIQLPLWASGNPIVLLLSNGGGQRQARTYDDNPARSALLHIEYTNAPTISTTTGSCSALNEVTVVFSKDVDATTAQTAANYSLDNGVTISGASLTSSNTVTLTTSALTDMTTYTLTVNNIEDLVGNVIAANSTFSFTLNCSGLIAYYRLDESSWSGTANEVVDQSGNNLHGRSVGGVTTSEAYICNGAILDGITLAYVEVADNNLLDIPDELTVSLWMKSNVIPGGGLKSILSKDENYEFHIDSGGHIYWWWNRAGGGAFTLTSNNTITVGQWYHIAIVYSKSGAYQKIFIDGVEDPNTNNRSESLMTNADPLQIGGDQAFATREFDGLIDEVRIYERALSLAEINADMNASHPCSTPVSCSFRDNFASVSYGNNDGTLSWTADWFETNDDGLPTGGDAYITGGHLVLTNTGGSLPEITRELDLTGATSATLEFAFSTTAGVDNNDRFQVEVSGDGGVSWTTLETIDGITGASIDSRSYNIDAYINNNTRIRFLIRQRYDGANEAVHFYYVAVLPGGLCVTPSLDHYAITHDGTGIICLPEQVTISSHDASHVLVDPNTSTITLSTSTSRGTWSRVVTGTGVLTDATAGDGLATYAFPGGETSVTLAFNYTSPAADPEAVNFNITDGTYSEDATEDNNLTFSMAGFLIVNDTDANQTIPVQIAGKNSDVDPNSKTLGLQAVRTSDSDSTVCEPIFTSGADIVVGMGAECLDPSTCAGQQVSIINNAATTAINTNADNSGAGTSSYTDVTLRFSADSKAEIALNYPDAGQIQLHARYNIPFDDGGAPPASSGNYLTGSSNAFVVRPFGFDIDFSDDRSTNGITGPSYAADSAGSVFTTAGTAFGMDITAVIWNALDDDKATAPDTANDGIPDSDADLSDNASTPNFGKESSANTVTITRTLNLPAGGSSGTLTVTNPSTGPVTNNFAGTDSDSNTIASTSANWSEVGIIDLHANLTDYLGSAGVDVTGTVINVGRFIPDRFNVTINPGKSNWQASTAYLIDDEILPVIHNGHLYKATVAGNSGAVEPAWPTDGSTVNDGTVIWEDQKADLLNNHCNVVAPSIPFTYLDEPFSYISSPQTITIEALNTSGNITNNYGGDGTANDFWKLPAPTLVAADYTDQAGVATSPLSIDNVGTVAINQAADFDGDGTLETSSAAFHHPRPTARIAPFNASFNLALKVAYLTDSDSVCYDPDADSICDPFTIVNITGPELRFGRLNINNAYGPETENLAMPLTTQYYDGTTFQTNTLDSCTSVTLSFGSFTGNLAVNETCVLESMIAPGLSGEGCALPTAIPGDQFAEPPVSGDFNLNLQAPGLTNDGSVDTTIDLSPAGDDLPWLQYDWDDLDGAGDGPYDDNPTGRATFGIYRGNDRIINWQEIVR